MISAENISITVGNENIKLDSNSMPDGSSTFLQGYGMNVENKDGLITLTGGSIEAAEEATHLSSSDAFKLRKN